MRIPPLVKGFALLALPLAVLALPPGDDAPHRVLHALNRLSYGPRPGDIERVTALGVERYIQEQLHPRRVPDSPLLEQQLASLRTLTLDAPALAQAYSPPLDPKTLPAARQAAQKRAGIVSQEATQARLARALLSPRQLEEVMVEFWFNHFNVYDKKNLTTVWTGAYEREAIRPHVLGRFRALLGATAKHPAMLTYLDNVLNTAPGSRGARGRYNGLNENYARELLELHTLGVDGGYTQADVVALAKILTGWGVGGEKRGGRGRFFFNPNRHDFSDKVLLGHMIKGRGQAEGEEALDLLARHPATARFIAQKLARHFIADDPPDGVVARLAEVFRATDGDIRAVLDALFHSPEFWDPAARGTKFKTPYRYLLSCLRAAGVNELNPRATAAVLRQMGMPLYGCATPDGYKDTAAAWLNSDALLKRINLLPALTSGHSGLVQPDPAMAPGKDAKRRYPPVSPDELRNALGGLLSPATLQAEQRSPPPLRAAVLLGGPDMMRY